MQKTDTLLQQTENKAAKLAAFAAYQNGCIAENNIDYRRALTKYQRAVELQPDNAVYQVALNKMELRIKPSHDPA